MGALWFQLSVWQEVCTWLNGANQSCWPIMSDEIRETATIVGVFHVDEARNAETGEAFALAHVRLSNDTVVRIPIAADAAAQLAALLARVCERHGWQPPNVPIHEDKIQ